MPEITRDRGRLTGFWALDRRQCPYATPLAHAVTLPPGSRPRLAALIRDRVSRLRSDSRADLACKIGAIGSGWREHRGFRAPATDLQWRSRAQTRLCAGRDRAYAIANACPSADQTSRRGVSPGAVDCDVPRERGQSRARGRRERAGLRGGA